MAKNQDENPRKKIAAKVLHSRWMKVVSVMACIVTFCTVYALILPAITMSSQDANCGLEEHVHTAECYDTEGNLICGLEEHVHTLACYSDPYADIENEDVWIASIPELSGDRNADVVAVAASQLGYRESDTNYLVSDSDETKGYTRYGHWYGDAVDGGAERLGTGLSVHAYDDWDAMFVSYVLNYAGITDLGFDSDAGNWAGALAVSGKYVDPADYTPKAGDLIFFTPSVDSKVQVGIVTDVNKGFLGIIGNKINSLSVILGNSNNSVEEIKVSLEKYEEGDVVFEKIHGYGVLSVEEQAMDYSVQEEMTDNTSSSVETDQKVPDDERTAEQAAVDLERSAKDEDEKSEEISITDTATEPLDDSTGKQTEVSVNAVESEQNEESTGIVESDTSEEVLDVVIAADSEEKPADASTMKQEAAIDEIVDAEETASEQDDNTQNYSDISDIAQDTEHIIGMSADELDTDEELSSDSVKVSLVEHHILEDESAIIMNWHISAQIDKGALPVGAIIRVDTSTGKNHAMTASQVKMWGGIASISGENVSLVENDKYETTFIGSNGNLYTWDDVRNMDDNSITMFTGVYVKVLEDIMFSEENKTIELAFESTAQISDANAGQNYYVTKVSVFGNTGSETFVYKNGEAVTVDQNKVLRDAGLENQTVGTLTAEGDDYTVTLSYEANAGIPDVAKLKVSEIKQGTIEYNQYIEKAKTVLGISKGKEVDLQGRFFDIKIMSKEGEVTPQEKVKVDICYKESIQDVSADDVSAVHFAKEGAESVDVETSEDGGEVNAVAFEAESFSVYGVVYTVDFTFDGYTYSIGEDHTITLSELIKILDIEEDIDNVTDVKVELVQQNDNDVNSSEFYVEHVEGDWLLKSDVAFGNVYTMTIVMSDGANYVITITDAGSNLTPMLGLVNITIGGQNVTGDDWTVKKDQVYALHLSFAETPDDDDHQFGAQTMTYTLPASFNISSVQGTFDIKYNEQSYGGNTYSIDPTTHVVTIHFDDTAWGLIQSSGNASFTLDISGSFSNSQNNTDFGNGIKKNVTVDATHDVDITKTGKYNAGTNNVDYELTVTSSGVNENVTVTDTITGTALDFLGISNVSVEGATSSYTTTPHGDNGFQTVITRMGDGETVKIKYSASVDFGNITGTGTVTETSNGVTIKAKDVEQENIENNVSHTIDYNPLSKDAGTASGDGNTKTLPWTITVNPQQLKDVSGTTITDTISQNSQSIMNYSGSGLTVTVMDGSTQVGQYTVDWQSLNVTPGSSKTWSYKIPDTYKNHSYEYIITYNTTVDVSGRIGNTTVNNGVHDDEGHADPGQGTVGPGTDDVHLAKSVVTGSVNAEDITWEVTFKVPAAGLTSAVVTDTYPNKWAEAHLIDTIKGIVSVSGTIDGEFYDEDYSDDTKAVISFYYYDEDDNRVEGLKPSTGEREIKVTLKTKNDPTWLTNYVGDTHTNEVELSANGQVVKTDASAQPPSKGIVKEHSNTTKVTINGIEYPVYEYTLSLHDVEDTDFVTVGERTYLEVEDDYDQRYFRFYDASNVNDGYDRYWTQVVYRTEGGWDMVMPREVATIANERIVDSGGKLKFRLDKSMFIKNGEDYYASYTFKYNLIVIDETTLTTLNQASLAAASNGFKVEINNTVEWGTYGDGEIVEYQYPAIDKKLLSSDPSHRLANYEIVINPGKLPLNGGHSMDMKDNATNLSIDYQTINITVEPASGVTATADDVVYYYSGNTGFFTIPDRCKVTITYSARIIGDGSVEYKNDVLMKDFSDFTTKTDTMASVSEGELEINWLRLYKHVRFAMNKPLDGAEYTLCDANGNIIFYPPYANNDKAGEPVTFTTGTQDTAPQSSGTHEGYVQIYLDQNRDGLSLQKGRTYYLKETKAPPGYQLSTRIYRFTIADHPDYDDYEYYNNDLLRMADTPEKGVIEVTKSFVGAENLTETQKEQIQFTITGVDDSENQIFNQTISYADFTDGKYRFGNLDPGTYTVTETSWTLPGYTYRQTTYTVDGDTGNTDKTGEVTITQADITNKVQHNVAYTNEYESVGVSVNIKKVNETKNDSEEEQIYLYGAEFQLYKKNSENEYELFSSDALTSDSKFTISYENRENGVTITGLSDGEYKLVETKAPDGYYASPDYLEFVISNNVVNYKGDVKPPNLVTVENNSLVISNKTEHSYTLTKQDALSINKKLQGAEFQIYTYVGDNEVGGPLYTNSEGKIKINFDNNSMFTTGVLYYIKEENPPVGYVMPETPKKYYFYIGGSPDGLATLSANHESVVNVSSGPKESVVPNTPEKTSIEVEKKWKNSSNQDTNAPDEITSIQFKLYQIATDSENNVTRTQYPNENSVYTIEKNDQGNWPKYKIENLPTGSSHGDTAVTYTYEVQEVPINGFLTNYLGNGVNTGTIVITNKPKYESTKFEVQKCWLDEDGNELSNVPDSIKVELKQAVSVIDGHRVQVHAYTKWNEHKYASEIVKDGTDVTVYIQHGGSMTLDGNVGTWDESTQTLTFTNVTSDIEVTLQGTDWVNPPVMNYTQGDPGEPGEASTIETVTLRASDNWHKSWDNLNLKTPDRNLYVYSVEEIEVDGKTPSEAGYTVAYENNDGIQKGIIYINNIGQPQIDFTINKQDEFGSPLSGATFQLKKKDSVGAYVVFDNTSLENDGTILVNETATIQGLKDGEYRLEETIPPTDFILPEDVFVYFTIADGTVTYTDQYGMEILTQKGIVFENESVTVTNRQGYALPNTGGIGTTAYRTAGIVMLITALFGVVLKKRRERECDI